jgi:hypothetical protein
MIKKDSLTDVTQLHMKTKINYLFTPLFHHPFIPSSFEKGKPSRFMPLFNVLYSSIGTEGWLKAFLKTKISKYHALCVT